MQGLFAGDTPWRTPWIDRIRPRVHRLAAAQAARTIFTRFLPPERPEDAERGWRGYDERWSSMTLRVLDPGLIELLPELAALAPPAAVVDKATYSPFVDPDFGERLRAEAVEALVVSGTETDVCILATVLGAVDRGFRVIVATDAVCGSADETHDALMTVYHSRFGQQIETARTGDILDSWT